MTGWKPVPPSQYRLLARRRGLAAAAWRPALSLGHFLHHFGTVAPMPDHRAVRLVAVFLVVPGGGWLDPALHQGLDHRSQTLGLLLFPLLPALGEFGQHLLAEQLQRFADIVVREFAELRD